MSRIEKTRSRALAALAALAASAAVAATLASPAAAASPAAGGAVIKPAEHAKGRTLSGQGVSIVAGSGATGAAGGMLTLPIGSLETGAAASAQSSASLSFKHGKDTLALSGIDFDLAKNELVGSLDGQRLAVFKLGGGASADGEGVSLQGGKLRLTADAAKALKQKLGLQRTLVQRGVGMVWLSARVEAAKPAEPISPVDPDRPVVPDKPVVPSVPRVVTSGSIDWGFLASWRSYVLLSPPAGTTEISEGATATGELTDPATTFGFPAFDGEYLAASGSAPAELWVASEGSVDWAKPGHGINEVRLFDLEVELAPSGSWLIADVATDFGVPELSEDVRFASLDPSAVTPAVTAGSVTWTAVPATLTAEGAASFAGFYEAGKELEPVNVTAELE
jgi:hypothetical protein